MTMDYTRPRANGRETLRLESAREPLMITTTDSSIEVEEANTHVVCTLPGMMMAHKIFQYGLGRRGEVQY